MQKRWLFFMLGGENVSRVHDYIREFGNGNITFRLPPEDLKKIQEGKMFVAESISWILDELDCYIVGEKFCLGNYSMGIMIFNAYSSLCYVMDLSDIYEILLKGKRLRLYAKDPDGYDWEIINEELGPE